MRLKIESWCKKFCQITSNLEWKKNRNLHAISLLDMILNNRYEEPYNKFADDGPLCSLSKTYIKSKLSKKFWKATKNIYDSTSNNNIQNVIKSRKSSLKRANTPSTRSFQIKNNLNENIEGYIVDDFDDVDVLKKTIAKLQTNLNEKEQIIIQQNEEQIKLLQKIEQLEKLLVSLVKQKNDNNNNEN